MVAEYGVRAAHRSGGEVVDELAELTPALAVALQACDHPSRGCLLLPLSYCATESSRGALALVSMMQPADLGQFDHPAEFGPLHQPGFRRIALQ